MHGTAVEKKDTIKIREVTSYIYSVNLHGMCNADGIKSISFFKMYICICMYIFKNFGFFKFVLYFFYIRLTVHLRISLQIRTNEMLLVNDLYCDRCSALHVSGSFAHHQELILNCIAAYFWCLTVCAINIPRCAVNRM
jgi:hypothetical protein